MEIASFVKSLADRYRYGIDCIIDNNDLLALALSKMPTACIEPMESCNEGDESGITLTCGNFTSVITKNPNNNIVKLVIDKKVTSDNIDILIQKISTYKPFNLSVDYTLYNDSITVNEEQPYDLSGVDTVKAIEEFVTLLDVDKKADISQYCIDLYKRAQST